MRTLQQQMQYLQQEYLAHFAQDYKAGKYDNLFASEDEHAHCAALLALRAKYIEARANNDEFACACIAFAAVLCNVAEVGE